MVSAAALSVLLCGWHLHIIQQGHRVNCTVLLLIYSMRMVHLIRRSLQYSIQKKTRSSTHRSFKSCSQKCWHYTIWFNFISPWHTINIIWLICYSKHHLCPCSWLDLCCHFTGSWKVSVGFDLMEYSTVALQSITLHGRLMPHTYPKH